MISFDGEITPWEGRDGNCFPDFNLFFLDVFFLDNLVNLSDYPIKIIILRIRRIAF